MGPKRKTRKQRQIEEEVEKIEIAHKMEEALSKDDEVEEVIEDTALLDNQEELEEEEEEFTDAKEDIDVDAEENVEDEENIDDEEEEDAEDEELDQEGKGAESEENVDDDEEDDDEEEEEDDVEDEEDEEEEEEEEEDDESDEDEDEEEDEGDDGDENTDRKKRKLNNLTSDLLQDEKMIAYKDFLTSQINIDPIDHSINLIVDGAKLKYKERSSVIEEKTGKIEFRVVNSDNDPENMIVLTGLKNIFQKQLPKMPKEYIARLIFDRSHLSMAIIRHPLQVLGGITYKPFNERKFAEIVFCAVSSDEQVRGYGVHLMNHLKDYVKNTSPIRHFLTYADNYAIGYFKKQGFTKDISGLDKKVWMGYIKDYEGGTLMHCAMVEKIRYLDAGKILLLQEAAIRQKIAKISKTNVIREGLEQFKDLNNIKPLNPLRDIPGLKEAGWSEEMDLLAQRPKRSLHFAPMQSILIDLQNNNSAWPFLHPVNKDEVQDYYEFIKNPMDLSTVEHKLENNKYETFEEFIADVRLIFKNCRTYNNDTTSYFKYANKLEKYFEQKVRDFPEYSHLLD
ncbi:hypothetical protein QEN19_002430 [Hanseniaspora menglaensis]